MLQEELSIGKLKIVYPICCGVDFIGIKYYESEKSEREERKTWYNTQKEAVKREKELDNNYKFTGKKAVIGRPCSKSKAQSYVENVIYNQLMKEKRENIKPTKIT